MRRCSRTACPRRAVATLTYVYADSTAVLGPLATYAEPHTYDLCADHAERLTTPRGWDLVRLVDRFEEAPAERDDLLALADALREEKSAPDAAATPASTSRRAQGAVSGNDSRRGTPPLPGFDDTSAGRRGRLRVLRDVEARSADR